MKDFARLGTWSRILAVSVLLGVACAEPRGDGGDSDRTAPGQRHVSPPRPDTVHSTITIEGMDEPMTYWLYRSPPGFPLPFSTYVPTDMAAGPVAAYEAEVIRFVAEFGGRRNEQVILAIAVLPEGVDQDAALALARDVAERAGARSTQTAPDRPRRFSWSVEEWTFTRRLPDGATAFGSAALGVRYGRYFFVVTHFPGEYGDGFGPRAARILDEWRWEDTGEPLHSPGSGS